MKRIPGTLWRRQSRSNWIWAVALPSVALLCAWPTHGWSLVLLLAYPLLLVRIFRYALRRGIPFADACAYAWFTLLGKFPQALGQIRHTIFGPQKKLIEYKNA